jgi:PucR family transcriptional regulator, purine catabolism regulatory protein
VLTVADVLDFSVVKRGLPEVVSGDAHLDREVRWAHVLDVAEVTGLLRGGEFVLNNGFGIGLEARAQRTFIRELHEEQAAALAVELGILYRRALPGAMVDEAERLGLPLIALHRKTRFVEVTEAVHQRLMSEDFDRLRQADALSRRLTDLILAGGDVPELLAELARTLGNPVVLEDAAQRVVAWAAHQSAEELVLRAWEDLLQAERREREQVRGAVEAPIRLVHGPWGRLLALELDGPLGDLAPVIVQRGAEAIGLRLVSRHQEDELAADSRGAWLAELTLGRMGEQEAARRAAALGFERRSPRVATAALARRANASAEGRFTTWAPLASELRTALSRAGMEALIGPHEDVLLLLIDPAAEPELDRLAEEVAHRVMRSGTPRQLDESQVALAIGPFAESWTDAGRALVRAARRAAVAAREEPRLWHDARRLTLNDVLDEMSSSPTLKAFVADRLGPLLEGASERRRRDLLHTLETYLHHAGRKTPAAHELHLERQSLYHRLDRLQELLGIDWHDGEELLELHFALRARRLLE